jgi:hypothetical protein
MRETHSWQITVDNPALAQLRVTTLTTSTTFVQPGAMLTMSPTVINDGPAASGPFVVEFFLSTTTTWSTQNTFLGSVQVNGLPATQNVLAAKQAQLPWSLQPQIYYLHAVVDRTNQIAESNENDNTRIAALIGQTGPCITKLEYADPLLYPADSGGVSVVTGGTLHPTVVAPCANLQTTIYLIAWGGSGTVPGIQLSPSVHAPLNPDGFTDLGLAGLNSPILSAFAGLLDSQGIGRATFNLPPMTGIASVPTHFCCVLLGDTELFTGASNAIEMNLLP